MVDVRKVYVTSEVAKTLNVSAQHCLKIAKDLRNQDILSEFVFREVGKRNYLFNDVAVDKLKKYFSNN